MLPEFPIFSQNIYGVKAIRIPGVLIGAAIVIPIFFAGCNKPNAVEKLKKEPFGNAKNGEEVYRYTIHNSQGAYISVITFGAILQEVCMPDRRGKITDLVLGYDSLDKYLVKNAQFGTVVGRYGNRIARGHFRLDSTDYQLATNNGPNHLHGGPQGFDKKVWEAEPVSGNGYGAVKLHYLSRDGEEGYPGNLDVYVTYTLNDRNEIRIDYQATTDKPTVLNLTNHSYFNLNGQGSGDVLGEELTLMCDQYLPTDSTAIPLGAPAEVAGTPFDFRSPHSIGERIYVDNEQLHFGKGYDHSFIIRGNPGTLRPAARLVDKNSGRVLEVLTTQPAVQLYIGNNLNNTFTGKAGKGYDKYYAVCLETQHYPDSPNHPEYPTTVLRPGQNFSESTVFRFSVEK